MRKITAAMALVAVGLPIAALSGDVRAGTMNLETGEQCWGENCWDSDDLPTAGTSGSGGSAPVSPDLTVHDCSVADEALVRDAINWLSQSLSLVDGHMGQDTLMDWPGNTRGNFEDKLWSGLDIYCIDQKNKCTPKEDGELLGVTYPVVAPKRINLCAGNLRRRSGMSELTSFVHTIAHEIGHLIRANVHRPSCAERYNNPRFSQAIGLAAECAHRGITYDANDFRRERCPSAASDSTHATAEEIIEMKNNNPPPLVF